jgi:glutamine amidotransferase-like uncharacterized protein
MGRHDQAGLPGAAQHRDARDSVQEVTTILYRVQVIASVALISLALTGCETRDARMAMHANGRPAAATAIPPTSSGVPPILLFNGTGTSANDVAAVETVVSDNHLSYATANSSELNDMSEAQLTAYRLLIVPGGNFITIGNNLRSSTTANIHNAVQNGLSYLGICAGGFLAGSNGLNLASGVQFGFYADEDRGVRKTAVAIAVAGAPTLDHYWEDGPQFAGWGAVVGKYPNGTPAIVEGTSGKGWVILSGVHPEAPASWRHGMTFTTPVSVDNAYAGTLIHAALNRTQLPHY